MKRPIVILLITLFVSAEMNAQSAFAAWGIKGGLNVSGMQTDNTLIVSNKTKTGWQFGVFSHSIKQGWGYWLEANIMTLGSTQVLGDESQQNTIGYIAIPVAMQYRTENKIGFSLGGYASFRLWAKRKSTKVGIGDFKANIKDNIAFMDYGAFVGLAYSTHRFLFDLRYLQGIPNINTNSQLNVKTHNTSGQFSIGYQIK